MQEDAIFCPSCDAETEHIALKSGREHLARCDECGTIHPVFKERPRLASVKVIVNRGGTSRPYCITLPAREVLCVGEELLVDDASKEVVLAKITSLETDRRVDNAPASMVRTVWARAVDDVILKVSVYKRGRTQSLRLQTPGRELFHLGEVREVEGLRFKVTKIKLRGAGFADRAEAKEILRLWGRRL
jgi:uncharacterized Zn finger protein